jgi:RNA polymerase sigma factor (sigma-70 family)
VAEDFLQAYEDHVLDVYRYFAYRAVPAADAEDLTQLTFERALRAWGRFDPVRASVRTWLLAIARNAYIDFRRRNPGSREQGLAEEGEGEDAALPHDDPPRRYGLDPELEAAIKRLRRREREVLALRFGGDLRGPEIAELLGISLANAQQILSRALRKLRGELDLAGAHASDEPTTEAGSGSSRAIRRFGR